MLLLCPESFNLAAACILRGMKKTILIALVAFTVFCTTGCPKKKSKNVSDNPVPSVAVNITLYPGDPLNFKLQAIGGWMYTAGGINGIIVYHKSDQEFVAMERTSSHLPDNPKARVSVMSDNFTLIDSVSGSRWRIFDGSVVKGPAEWGLRLYGTVYDGNAVKIVN